MADEQYRWLNGETAELLLRGESVEAVEAVGSVDASARDQVERLAGALGALSVPGTPAQGELPGEAAAVAAFRKTVEARTGDAAARSGAGCDPSGDVGLVRIGRPGRAADDRTRPRLRRPVRLGLAAALLLGSVGGAAALAATGVIPGPFDDSEPGPAATVSAAVTPDRTAGSATPDGTATGGPRTPATGGAGGGGGSTARDGSSAEPGSGATGPPGGGVSGWKGVTGACRDLRDGKNLGVGRTRALEAAAGGASRVPVYCQGVLRSAGERTGSSNGQGNGNADGGGQDSGNADGNGNGNGKGNTGGNGNTGGGNGNSGGQGEQGNQDGGGGDDNGPIRKGHGVRRRDVTAVTPSPAAFVPPVSPSAQGPSAPEGTLVTAFPSPDPAYSAL